MTDDNNNNRQTTTGDDKQSRQRKTTNGHDEGRRRKARGVVHPPPGWQVSACHLFQRPALMVGTAAATTTTTTMAAAAAALSPSTSSTAGSGPLTGSQPKRLGTDVSSSSGSKPAAAAASAVAGQQRQQGSGSNNSGRGRPGHVNRRVLDVRNVVGAAHRGSPRFNAEPTVPAGNGCRCAPIIRTGTVWMGMCTVSKNWTHSIPVQGLTYHLQTSGFSSGGSMAWSLSRLGDLSRMRVHSLVIALRFSPCRPVGLFGRGLASASGSWATGEDFPPAASLARLSVVSFPLRPLCKEIHRKFIHLAKVGHLVAMIFMQSASAAMIWSPSPSEGEVIAFRVA